jgi:hypothetical protein
MSIKENGMPTGNTGGDDNHVGASEGVLETIVAGQMPGDFLFLHELSEVTMNRRTGSGNIHTATEEMWDRSAATPGVLTTSYRASSSTRGLAFSNSDSG